MQNIRAVFLGLIGIAAIGSLVVLTASITLAFAGMLAVFTVVRALTPRLKPAPVRARAKGARPDMRVWNDGRGTIIDL
ncbi:hypothetical protein SAMN05880590_11463 [Rhizobium sp. RU35A]|uniref:Uncharacterized protein n=1 Tax=Rhizobium straminoryzae TaxID=1387186 RepID=A0A549SV11_9HYPH|nr:MULTISPECIES: hypothetical protein [Rhizobium]TRL33476.1 hypothetical protein FNA46_22850 [Rhizobium straminoryzae]SIR22349.1 hypothetical protein SAMN05880590_11463 [Rhizobium sp. RU35A]